MGLCMGLCKSRQLCNSLSPRSLSGLPHHLGQRQAPERVPFCMDLVGGGRCDPLLARREDIPTTPQGDGRVASAWGPGKKALK